MEQVLNRFLKYVVVDTQSDTDTGLTPSTPGQMEFAIALAEELKTIGLEEVSVDDNGYVMATVPATTDEDVPVIGFVAHMDTSPDFTGKNVKPRVISNYQGGDIVLNESENIILKAVDFPEVEHYIGQDLVVTDGKTLLGADDKAGVAEIVTAAEYLINHPEIKHGKIRIGFTPDEEIGAGADHFDVKQFGAEFAYTLDGSQIGELEYENFNAAGAKITVNGRMVHPGYAKNKMRNSIRIANQIITMLPRHETPEHTEGYEGFYHLMSFNGDVEKTELVYIIRDFKRDRFEDRKREVQHLINKINAEYGEGTASVDIKDQYYNMREKVEPVMYVVDFAKQAMEEVGVKPIVKPIRGGTDGSRLSYMGLPCPNIFAGGHNFHGRFEFVPVQSMHKAVEVILKIAELVAKKH
ncbi:peptidase T [Carboxylicivirga sediminis]|uniref:Peptidase T n=1 Tax=Carboxylicivirga sediminis TaxID=2006564 RepID=A0A941F3V4_9BACT|nr:peptidase T [Carboxylicivirga sediminis]MBR8536256.1 peptidase T [Carboxylicivirga sediminis]